MIIRLTILTAFVSFSLYGCKDKMVCAAYQSSYLLDDGKQSEYYSFFQGDSLVYTASNERLKKNIYGLKVKDYGYWSQQRMLTVDQVDVYSDEVDSLLQMKDVDPNQMAESGIDSTYENYNEGDTIKLSADGEDEWSNTKRFNYNVDFVNYMLLVGNDVLKAQSAARDSAAAKAVEQQSQPADSTNSGTQGVLKKLFNSGNKEKKGTKSSSEPTKEELEKEE